MAEADWEVVVNSRAASPASEQLDVADEAIAAAIGARASSMSAGAQSLAEGSAGNGGDDHEPQHDLLPNDSAIGGPDDGWSSDDNSDSFSEASSTGSDDSQASADTEEMLLDGSAILVAPSVAEDAPAACAGQGPRPLMGAGIASTLSASKLAALAAADDGQGSTGVMSLANSADSAALAAAAVQCAATVASVEGAAAESSAASGLPHGPITLVLLGKTGNGKSSTGNTILGHKAFEAKRSASPVTSESQVASSQVDGREVTVIDTPGLFDGAMSEEAVQAELVRALGLAAAAGGPLVLVLVLSAGCKFTAEESVCLERLASHVGPAALGHALVAFTHGDELEADNTPLYDYLRDAPPFLKELLDRVGQRTAVINNRLGEAEAGAREQVAALLATADGLLEDSGGAPLPLAPRLAARLPGADGSLVAAGPGGTVLSSEVAELAEQLRAKEAQRAELERQVRDGPRLRRSVYAALTACGLIGCRLLLGCGRSTGAFKAGSGGSQSVINMYGPVTWTLEPQTLLSASLPDGLVNGSGLGGMEFNDMPPLAMVQ